MRMMISWSLRPTSAQTASMRSINVGRNRSDSARPMHPAGSPFSPCGVWHSWHPLLLLNHVTILSTICYAWEQKRPSLTRIHWWAVLGGLALVDAM